MSIFDFTDWRTEEIAYFDRGPINGEATDGKRTVRGNIYGGEMARGIDVFRLKPSGSCRKTKSMRPRNPPAGIQLQNQPKLTAADPAVARPVINRPFEEHLGRGVRAINEDSKVDALRTGKEGNAGRVDQPEAVAAQETDGKSNPVSTPKACGAHATSAAPPLRWALRPYRPRL